MRDFNIKLVMDDSEIKKLFEIKDKYSAKGYKVTLEELVELVAKAGFKEGLGFIQINAENITPNNPDLKLGLQYYGGITA